MSSHNFGKTTCCKVELLYVPRPSVALSCMGLVPTALSIFVVYGTLLAVILIFMIHNIYINLLRWFNHWPLIVVACPSETCGHTGIETDFSPSTSVFCYCSHSTNAAYLYLTQLPPMLCNLGD